MVTPKTIIYGFPIIKLYIYRKTKEYSTSISHRKRGVFEGFKNRADTLDARARERCVMRVGQKSALGRAPRDICAIASEEQTLCGFGVRNEKIFAFWLYTTLLATAHTKF